jgi:hypothetical protein
LLIAYVSGSFVSTLGTMTVVEVCSTSRPCHPDGVPIPYDAWLRQVLGIIPAISL